MMRSSLLLTSILTVSTFVAMPIQAKVVDEVSKTFDVSADSQFQLSNINGSVEVSGWDKDQIQVSAIITAKNQDDRDRIRLEMEQTSLGVIVETKYEKESRWRDNGSGKVEYVIKVPHGASLSDIELVNGSLLIENVSGKVNAELVNGSIKAKGLAATTELSSVNGSIKAWVKSAEQSLKHIEIETVNGSIKLYLPDDISASVDVDTMHGSIKNDFGLQADKNMFVGNNLKGDIGNGDVKVSLESVNGSVKILKN